MSVCKVNVTARNPKQENRATPPLEALADSMAHRFVATTTLVAAA